MKNLEDKSLKNWKTMAHEKTITWSSQYEMLEYVTFISKMIVLNTISRSENIFWNSQYCMLARKQRSNRSSRTILSKKTNTSADCCQKLSLMKNQKKFLMMGSMSGQPSRQLDVQINNGNTRTRCEICLKLTIKTLEQCQWCRSDVFIVSFEYISLAILVLLLLTLSR